jgi:hypothetical protein
MVNGEVTCTACVAGYCFTCSVCNNLFHNYDRADCDEFDEPRVVAHGTSLCYRCYERMATWKSTDVVFNGDIGELKSTRRFGIELETASCDEYRSLRDKTVYGAKHDGSISGMEFVSPILQGDQGLRATRGFCTRAKHKGFTVDSDCGYHLHIDVSSNTPIEQRHIAYAYGYTRPFWARLVDSYRANDCNWCGSTGWEPQRMVTCYHFDRFAGNQNRYTWFNIAALARFGTFEIRLHEGTIDSRTICNWVKAHLRFADFVQGMRFSQIAAMFNVPDRAMWRAVTNTWNDPALRRYYRRVSRANALDN